MPGPSCRGLWVIIPLCVGGGSNSPPFPHSLYSKAHSVWGGFEEPGHPAARPNPDQRRTPPCSWLRMWSVLLSSPHPCPGNVYSHVCACIGILSGPLGLPVSLSSQTHNRNHQGDKAVGLGLLDPAGPVAGAHLGLVPGGLEMLDASHTIHGKEGRCCFVLKGLTPANRRYLRPQSPSVSFYNPANRLKDKGLCQGHPSSWRLRQSRT